MFFFFFFGIRSCSAQVPPIAPVKVLQRQNNIRDEERTASRGVSERLLYSGGNDVILHGDEMTASLTSFPFSLSLSCE